MKYLLDTHTLLWHLYDDPKLSDAAKTHIDNPQNEIFVSMASVWEIAIKTGLQRISFTFPGGTKKLIEAIDRNNIILQNITPQHIAELETLPLHHRDPFDRIIIATAISQKWSILSKDEDFPLYSVKTIW